LPLCFLLAAPLLRQSVPDPAPMEQAARNELDKLNVPGASSAIVRGGGMIYSKGVTSRPRFQKWY